MASIRLPVSRVGRAGVHRQAPSFTAEKVTDNFVSYYDLGIKEHNLKIACNAAIEAGDSYGITEASITDEETVDDLVADTDIVYHQAAQAGVQKGIEPPTKINHYNVDGIINVLEGARSNDIERVAVASSTSVYGKSECLLYDETHPTTPVSS